MAVITHLETDTGTNVDISGATAVGAYTANGDKLIMVDVSIDAVAGNGDYVMYVTRQIGGSGSAYRILPQTTMAAASGLTAISAQSGWITVRNGDVLTCYVDGLAGDTSTPDWSTRWFELAGVTAAAVADAVWDEAISGHTTGTTFGGKNQKVVPSETINDYKADVSALTNVTLAAAYDKAKDDVLTPLAVVDSIVDGLKTTLDNIHDTDLPAVKTDTAAIKSKTNLIPATPASAGEYTAAIAAIPTAPLLAANYTAPDNASIATIKAKTNLIPANPAVADEYDAALAAIQADLDNPNQYKADVSALMLASSYVAPNNAGITAIKAKTDNLPANTATALAAIQSDLDNPAQYKADVSGLATQASVNAIPTTPLLAANYTAPNNAGIASILEDTGTTIPATLAGLATSTEVGAITMLDEVVVGSYTMQDILKILAAKMVGKATGGGTTTITYHGVDDTSDVIIETVDSNGNRSAVTLTV